MILVDANLLIYAHHETAPQHQAARTWLEGTLDGDETVAIALAPLLAFIRISTNVSLFKRALNTSGALAIVEGLRARQNVHFISPTERHWEILGLVATKGQARGPLLMDAHLAALAIEHNATLATNDRGFARFPGLKLQFPLAA